MSTGEGPGKVYVETSIPILQAIYRLLFDSQSQTEIAVLDCTLSLFGTDAQAWYVPRKNADSSTLDTALLILQRIRSRAADVRCSCTFQILNMPVPPISAVLQRIVSSGNRKLAELTAGGHVDAIVETYMSSGVSPNLDRHAGMAFKLKEFLSAMSLNNIGYYYLAQGNLDAARALLDLSVKKWKSLEKSAALPMFNLAMVCLQRSDRLAALELLESITSVSGDDEDLMCLLVPKLGASGLSVVEVKGNLSLKAEIKESLNLLQNC
jgi:hypothetical protein